MLVEVEGVVEDGEARDEDDDAVSGDDADHEDDGTVDADDVLACRASLEAPWLLLLGVDIRCASPCRGDA